MGIARLAASVTACGISAGCSLDYVAVAFEPAPAPADAAGAGGSSGEGVGGESGHGGVGGGGGSRPAPVCGDGVVDGSEACDTGEPWCVRCQISCEAPAFFDETTKHCYFLIERYIFEWTTARQKCAEWRVGADLAAITTQAETDTILQHLAGNGAFIGLYEPGRSSTSVGPWEWVTGEPFGEFLQWGDGQPDLDDENCAALWSDPPQWHNVGCDWSLPALCEWQAPR